MSKPLTPKEERIIALVAEGLPNKDIAGIVGATEHGVKNHLKTNIPQNWIAEPCAVGTLVREEIPEQGPSPKRIVVTSTAKTRDWY